MTVELTTLVKPADDRPEVANSAPQARPIVAMESVTLAYGRVPVLKNLSMRVHAGDFWCLLGPNGEGKTTFIKALLGAIKPAKGKIFLRADFAQRTRIGFVPQECHLNSALPTTVREFILCGLAGLNFDGRTRDLRLSRVLEVMGLSRLRDRSFWTLSGGQRQRTLVARALVRDPLLLVVDEPTAGLDWAAASSLLEIITDLNRNKGITVIFVTHDLGLAAERSSHVALFRQGLVLAGKNAEVFTEENLSRTFGLPIQVVKDSSGRLSVRTAQVNVRL